MQTYNKYSKEVLKLYKQLDIDIEKFKKSTGLKCIKNCGVCCEKDTVEATILEFFPLCFDLWKKDQAEHWLSILEQPGLSDKCIFYKPDNKKPKNGRCGIYPHRSLICRLFNFSAITDKYDKTVYLACRDIKKKNKGRIKKAQEGIDKGLSIPKMRDYSMKIYNIYPVLGLKYYPINTAIKLCLEITGMRMKYNSSI